MNDILKNDHNYNTEIVSHYDLLKRIGVLDQIEHFEQQIKNKDKLLDEVTELISQTTRVDLINFITTRMLNELVPMNLVFVIQAENSLEEAEIIYLNQLKRTKTNIIIDSIKPYQAFFSKYPHIVTFEDFHKNISSKKLADIFISLEPEFIMPLIGLGGIYGFIIFGKKIINPGYTPSELEYIEKIVTCASVCLQNSMHYKTAIMDAKTDLYSHYFFLKRFNEELSRVIRYKMTLSILMLDLDHFKLINDTYGHTAGDKVLYEVSRLIEKNIRKGDIAARFGGEEYIILLIECKESDSIHTAERIREAVEKAIIKYHDQEIKVTLSCGISTIAPSDKLDADSIIQQADKALYISKQSGRNKTTVYREE